MQTKRTIVKALDYLEACNEQDVCMLEFKLASVLCPEIQERVRALVASQQLANLCADVCDTTGWPLHDRMLAATVTPKTLRDQEAENLLMQCSESVTFKMPVEGDDVCFSTPVGAIAKRSFFKEARVEGFVSMAFLQDLAARTTSRLEMCACVLDAEAGDLSFQGQDLVFKLWPIQKQVASSFLSKCIRFTSSRVLGELVDNAPHLRTLTIRFGGDCTDRAAAATLRTIVQTLDPKHLQQRNISLFLDDPRGITALPSTFPEIYDVLTKSTNWPMCDNVFTCVDKCAVSFAGLLEMNVMAKNLKGNGQETAFSWSTSLALRAFRCVPTPE